MIRVGITIGDPAGIGPEVAVKALRRYRRSKEGKGVEFTAIGPAELWRQAGLPRGVSIVDTQSAKVVVGQERAEHGRVAFAALEQSIVEWQRGDIDAVVTAPVSKTALHLAGHKWPGQTEFYAARTGTQRFAMMLSGPRLRVVLTSTHLSLRDAVANLSSQAIAQTALLADHDLKRVLGRVPRLALAALNPHAGEGGKFGDEEKRILQPAVKLVNKRGVELLGPIAADTLFYRAARGEFDAVIVLFHDQGLIPLKLLHFDVGVNVTLGLPLVRTSPDHGTAFDIAGKGIAQASSMHAAIVTAVQHARAMGKKRGVKRPQSLRA